MSSRKIVESLSIEEFKELRGSLGNKVLIVKFSADWCKPCQKIKPFVEQKFGEMPENVVIADIDIDETMDLYIAFKNKKMLNGVPSLLAFYGDVQQEPTQWYVSDKNVSGSKEEEVGLFFKCCSDKAKTL